MPRPPKAESVMSEPSSSLSSVQSKISDFFPRKRQDHTSAIITPESPSSSRYATPATHSGSEEHWITPKTVTPSPVYNVDTPTPSPLAPPSPPSAPQRRYRQAVEAPETFKEQTQILLEEKIYHLAIQGLQTNLFSRSYLPSDEPWWVAPPAHIALLGTLVIHPSHTTRATDDKQKMVVVRAHQYLLDVLRSVGPINGHFKTAFSFRDRSSRADRRRRHLSELAEEDQLLENPLANDASIWNRMPDFWTMLGWAFSCAANHPERWVHWKPWVELLLEVLERDLEERLALDEERNAELSLEGEDKEYPLLRESIIMSYVGEHQLGTIMRVLFAFIDKSTHSYQEVWPRETQSPTATNKRKRDIKVDLEHDEYGDWDAESESEPSADEPSTETKPKPTKKRSKRAAPKKQPLPLVANPTLEETIPVRLRLFALISKLCFHLRDGPFDLATYYEHFAQHVRGLPLDAFPRFVWSDMPVDPTIYITLSRAMLDYLLPPGIRQPNDVDPETNIKGFVSGVMLERCFLPYACSSVAEDNAKLAVVLWELFCFLFGRRHPVTGEVDLGPGIGGGMALAIIKGIDEREKKSRVRDGWPGTEMVGQGEWVLKMVRAVQKDRYAAANVLRVAHLKFRLLLVVMHEKEWCKTEAELRLKVSEGVRSIRDLLSEV